MLNLIIFNIQLQWATINDSPLQQKSQNIKQFFYQVSLSFSIKYNFSLSLIFLSQSGLSLLPSLFFVSLQHLSSPSLGSWLAFLSWHRPFWLELRSQRLGRWSGGYFYGQGGFWLGFCGGFWVQKTNLKNGRTREGRWVVLLDGSCWVTDGVFLFFIFTQVVG